MTRTESLIEAMAKALFIKDYRLSIWEDMGEYWKEEYRQKARVVLKAAKEAGMVFATSPLSFIPEWGQPQEMKGCCAYEEIDL